MLKLVLQKHLVFFVYINSNCGGTVGKNVCFLNIIQQRSNLFLSNPQIARSQNAFLVQKMLTYDFLIINIPTEQAYNTIQLESRS